MDKIDYSLSFVMILVFSWLVFTIYQESKHTKIVYKSCYVKCLPHSIYDFQAGCVCDLTKEVK